MTLLGMSLEQAAFSFGWGNLLIFSRHLPEDSAVSRAMNVERARFASDLQRSAILADIFDAVMLLSYSFAKVHSKTAPKKPQPYKRPWGSEAKKIGSDPIPISEFDSWYYGGD